MPDEARLLAAFALALTGTFAVTPVAIAVATRTGFQDRPGGHKGHGAATPYLGGAAVVAGFLLAAIVLGEEFSRLAPIPLLAAAVWGLGTLDDKLSLPMAPRLLAEAGVATALWALDLGWSVTGSDFLNLLLTNLWVIGLVNAFNLMDNMDGAAATVGSVTGLAVAVLAASQDDLALAVLSLALAGACLGFLPYNLAGPARIFLGDGGSLPIGLVIAATIMNLPHEVSGGLTVVLAALILAGLPVVDTLLVMISRQRSGVPMLRGGRDHLTHRLLPRLETPRQVALALALLQAGLGAFAIGVVQLGSGEVIAAWLVWFLAVAFTVALLETETWAPIREGVAARKPSGRMNGLPRPTRTLVEAVLVAFIAGACGVSPFLSGFYDPSVWGPVTLLLLAALFGLIVARPAAPSRAALVATGGLVAIWLWSLLSISWAESADQALTEANRWLFYAALFGTLVLLLRDDRLARIVISSVMAAVLALAVYLVGALLFADPADFFTGNRLTEPVGYVNGEAGYLLLGIWPLIALAEQTGRRLVSAAGIVGASLVAGLVFLTQTRGSVLAFGATALVLLALVPGRRRRLWALVAVLGALAVMAPALTDVYESSGAPGAPDEGTLRLGVAMMLAVSLAAGMIWWLAQEASARLVRSSESWRQRIDRAALVVPAVLVCLALLAGIAATGNPVDRVQREYDSFVQLEENPNAAETQTRLTSGGGNRYDYWRIAVNEFETAPLIGIGAGNYPRDYYEQRRTLEDVTQPHSLEFQFLAELGLVGIALLLVFLAGVAAGARQRIRQARSDPRTLGLVVAALGVFVSWLVHTSVDWLHVLPGITGVALAAAAVLVAPWLADKARWHRRHALLVAGCALLIALGAVMVGRWALADRYTGQSEDALPADPARSIERADAALELNDELLSAYYAKATAYARLGRYEPARDSLLEATRREPSNFLPWALLGDLAFRRGEIGASKRYYTQAWYRNRRDSLLGDYAFDPSFDGTPPESPAP